MRRVLICLLIVNPAIAVFFSIPHLFGAEPSVSEGLVRFAIYMAFPLSIPAVLAVFAISAWGITPWGSFANGVAWTVVSIASMAAYLAALVSTIRSSRR